MKHTYQYADGRPPFVVPRVKEIEQRNNDVTLVCDNELRVNVPTGWVSESQEADETRVFVPTRPDFVGITLPLFAHEEIIVPIARETVTVGTTDGGPVPDDVLTPEVTETLPVGDQPQ